MRFGGRPNSPTPPGGRPSWREAPAGASSRWGCVESWIRVLKTTGRLNNGLVRPLIMVRRPATVNEALQAVAVSLTSSLVAGDFLDAGYLPQHDINCDGVVDLGDIMLVAAAWTP